MAIQRLDDKLPMTANDLRNLLHRLDGRPYPAYKDLRGRYDFGFFMLSVDRVQGDPFAAPSRLSISIDHQDSRLPPDLFSNPSRRIGLENALAANFAAACRKAQSHLGSGKSGLLAIDEPGQEMLQRTCLEIGSSRLVARFAAGLPASGRRILGRAAATLLCEYIPQIVESALLYPNLDAAKLQRFADANEDADQLRGQLSDRGLVAFVADGALLPRASGIDQGPLKGGIPFRSPDSLRVALDLPHAGRVSGMGIPEGITLIVGGGYHGKSTLLNALERGVYNHRPEDGRQLVVTRRDATKVRAEDGRSVAGVDLSPFINNLPGGKDTKAFTTENASGSTSQAANIIEALETGCKALLLDEDISATNFLIRDARMQQLIADDKEPITPFVQRVPALRDEHGISTILVLGGSSDYFEPADKIIAMDNYLPVDLTEQAKALIKDHATPSLGPMRLNQAPRYADPSSISPYKGAAPYRGSRRLGEQEPRSPRLNVKARDTRAISFGQEDIDLSLLPQIVDPSQARTIGAALAYACEKNAFAACSLIEALERIMTDLRENGLSFLKQEDLAAIRLQELAAALNRLRSLRIR